MPVCQHQCTDHMHITPAKEAYLASARYTPPLPSGAFARLWDDAMMILPSGVKHGSCPCGAAHSYSSWHAVNENYACHKTISADHQRLPSALTISVYHQRLPSAPTLGVYNQGSPAERRKAGRGPSRSACGS